MRNMAPEQLAARLDGYSIRVLGQIEEVRWTVPTRKYDGGSNIRLHPSDADMVTTCLLRGHPARAVLGVIPSSPHPPA